MIVYGLYCRTSGKAYIGQHHGFDLSKRWNSYLSNKPNSHLQAAIRKYGHEAFEKKILAYASCQQELDLLEKFFIFIYQTTDRRFGYNLQSGGRQGPGRHIQDVRQRISKSCLKAWQRKSTKEMRRHAAIARLLWLDPSRKERMRRRVSRTLSFVWDHRSDEEKQQILKNLEAGRKKGRVSWSKGKRLGPLPENHRQAISKGLKKYWDQKKSQPQVKKPVQSVPVPITDQKKAVASASLNVLKEMKRQIRHIDKTLANLHTELKKGCLW